jgi:pimeloyl-ACP methyl ester carboxylesterase
MKVALMLHAIGSGPIMWEVSPIDSRGMADLLMEKGIQPKIPTLPGHCASYRDLAKVSGSDWNQSVKQQMREILLDGEIKEIYLIGFSMGGVLTLLALAELLAEGRFPESQLKRVSVLVVNTPVHIKGVSTHQLEKISRWSRWALEWIAIPNVPRPWETNFRYLWKALVSKLLPLSAFVEMMKLVWRLLDLLASTPTKERFQTLKQLVLVQAIPDKVVDPKSVEILHRLIGGKVIRIEGATHGFAESEAWEELQKVVHQIAN